VLSYSGEHVVQEVLNLRRYVYRKRDGLSKHKELYLLQGVLGHRERIQKG
jgi:hypothetical protein